MSQQKSIRLRPHHLLCTFCFEGKGYSPGFIDNYKRLDACIKNNPDSLNIEIVAETDDVCTPCPHKRGNLCETQEKVSSLDAHHSEMLHIKAGDVLTWNTILQKMKEHVTLSKFHKACATCQWKAIGICETKIRQLK